MLVERRSGSLTESSHERQMKAKKIKELSKKESHYEGLVHFS